MDNAVYFGVRVKEGKRGKFWPVVRRREFDEDNNLVKDTHCAVIGVGFDTKSEANDAVAEFLNGEWEWLD